MQNRIGLSVAGLTELYNQSAMSSAFCNLNVTTEKKSVFCVGYEIVLLTRLYDLKFNA